MTEAMTFDLWVSLGVGAVVIIVVLGALLFGFGLDLGLRHCGCEERLKAVEKAMAEKADKPKRVEGCVPPPPWDIRERKVGE